MNLQLIFKRKGIVLSMFFLLIHVSFAKSIIEIPGLFNEITNLSSKKSSVFQLVIIDLNNCQSCNVWYPELMKNSDSSIYVYFKGAKSKDKQKLAKRYNLAASRVIAGSLSANLIGPISKAIFIEVYENDDWVSVYSLEDIRKVIQICEKRDYNDIAVQSDDVFMRFEKTVATNSFIYGIADPLMQLARLHPDSSHVELYESSKYDSFFWTYVFPSLSEKDTAILNKSESILQAGKTNQILSLFYPVNIFAEKNRLFIATQPFIFRKNQQDITVEGINLIIEMDENWNIVNHWLIQRNDQVSAIVGFSFKQGNFYFGCIDLKGEYFKQPVIFGKETEKRNTKIIKYDLNLVNKFSFLEFSSNNIAVGINAIFFKNKPVVNTIQDDSSQVIDISKFTGIKLNSSSFYNNLYVAFIKDTLSALCSVNRSLILIKVVSGKLVNRTHHALENKYNPIYTQVNQKGYLFYQTKDDYFKKQINLN